MRLACYSAMFGMGLFMCTITTPWLLDSNRYSYEVATIKMFWLFAGWILTIYGGSKLYFLLYDRK